MQLLGLLSFVLRITGRFRWVNHLHNGHIFTMPLRALPLYLTDSIVDAAFLRCKISVKNLNLSTYVFPVLVVHSRHCSFLCRSSPHTAYVETRTVLYVALQHQKPSTQHFLYSSLSILRKNTLHSRHIWLRTKLLKNLFFCFLF